MYYSTAMLGRVQGLLRIDISSNLFFHLHLDSLNKFRSPSSKAKALFISFFENTDMEQIKIVVIVNKELVVVAGIKPSTYLAYLAAMITRRLP